MAAVVSSLLGVAALLSVTSQSFGARRIPWVQTASGRVEGAARQAGIETVGLTAFRKLAAGGEALILDTRPTADFDSGHIPGAISFPSETRGKSLAEWVGVLQPGSEVLVYCAGPHCSEAVETAIFLERQTGVRALVLVGGIEEWEAAGQPIE